MYMYLFIEKLKNKNLYNSNVKLFMKIKYIVYFE